MFDVQKKIFRDSIHGYIEIPRIVVEEIVDSELFQRLRNIEQTSMRILYPAARHDRFIHSLGVYALGVQAFKGFKRNVELKYGIQFKELKIDEEWWKRNYLLFTLACLLHDCAHAPFSHTFEFIFDIPKAEANIFPDFYINETLKSSVIVLSRLNYEIVNAYHSINFENDFLIGTDKLQGVGAPHEKLSAVMIAKEYKRPIHNIFLELLKGEITDQDYEFIARMIIGCHYKNETEPQYSVKNALISMLNSSAIDVDGLDYIVRDSYNSGMDSWSIDYKRIIESFTLTEISVFNECDVDKLKLDGVWLKDSGFNVREWKNGEVKGRALFNGFANGETDSILTTVNEDMRNVSFDKENRQVDTKDAAVVTIHPTCEFNVELKNTCRMNGIFTGRITGKYLGNISNSNVIPRKEYALAFSKTSVSVMQSAVEARNQEYLWVYSHPKVVYNSVFLQCHLLRFSARFLCCKKNNPKFSTEELVFECSKCREKHESEESIILTILGFETFLNGYEAIDIFSSVGYRFYRSCDDDLVALFKDVYYENFKRNSNKSKVIDEYFASYFSRKHKKPIWKSFMEFNHFFGPYTSAQQKELINLSSKISKPISTYKSKYGFVSGEIQKKLSKHGIENAVCVNYTMKTKEFDPYKTYLIFDEATVRLCDIMNMSMLKSKYEKEFFYIFGDIKKAIGYSTIPKVVESLSDSASRKTSKRKRKV